MAFFSFSNKSSSSPTPAAGIYHLKVKHLVQETPDTISVHFHAPPGVVYRPGQFLTLAVTCEGREERRAYSLSSSPFVDTDLAVTVKRVQGGKISNLLNDTLRVGDTLKVMAPTGRFGTDCPSDTVRHVMLVAGGSGITPLMSIAKSVLHCEPDSRVSLLYASRHEGAIIFKEQIERLTQQYGSRFGCTHVLSQPSPAWTGPSGRLHIGRVRQWVDQQVSDMGQAEFYVCGPEGMMETVQAGLTASGVAEARIHRELFNVSVDEAAQQVALTQAAADSGEAELKTRTVTVKFEGQTHQLTVPPDETILNVALDAGIDLPYSCQSGVCTACMGKCVSGKIHMDETEGLSEKEMAAGYVLVCVSHPLTADVVIEVE